MKLYWYWQCERVLNIPIEQYHVPYKLLKYMEFLSNEFI